MAFFSFLIFQLVCQFTSGYLIVFLCPFTILKNELSSSCSNVFKCYCFTAVNSIRADLLTVSQLKIELDETIKLELME